MICWLFGHRPRATERGAGGYDDPEAHGLYGAYEEAHELQEGRWL